MEQTNSGNLGVTENDLVAIGQAVDTLHSRIAKMDETIKQQRGSIESLEYDKRNLTHRLKDMERQYSLAKGEALIQVKSEVVEETEAQYARKIFVLEQSIREMDAENDIIADERDALQNKVVELESVCNEQRITIEGFRSKVPLAPAHPVFKSAIDSLKAKLGMNYGGNQD